MQVIGAVWDGVVVARVLICKDLDTLGWTGILATVFLFLTPLGLFLHEHCPWY
jgi:hypothetical protein